MLIHNFDPVFIDFGVIEIKWYSLAYIFGVFLGWIYVKRIISKLKKNKLEYKPIEQSEFDDFLVYLVIGIILGGRMGYVIFYDLNFFRQNFFEIFKLWHGGMSFHGGLLGVIISSFIFSKIKKTNFFKYTDIVACAAPIGLFLGRIANFINGELVGKVTTVPWAIIFPGFGNISRHPSQIYEAILEGVVLFVLINFLAFKKNLIIKTGYISSFFLIAYSTLRIFSENFREPDQHLGYFFSYFSMGTLLSFLTLISGFIIIFFIKKNEQNY